MDTLAVLVQWATDVGQKKTLWTGKRENGTYVAADDVELKDVLEAMGRQLEAQGIVPLRVSRVYTRRIPLVGGEPSLAIAPPAQRVPEGWFTVKQEMLRDA